MTRGASGAPSMVVYTAIFGDYERLLEQPAARDSPCDFIAFTDNPNMTSRTWDVRYVSPQVPFDSVRSARMIKILGHPDIMDYDYSLWIDNRVLLRSDPAAVAETVLSDHEIAIPIHDHRESVSAEFDAVLLNARESPVRAHELQTLLAAYDPDVLQEVPYWTAIIFRRRSESVRSAMTTWANLVLTYSRRDQLSVNYTLRNADLSVKALAIPNRAGTWHEWLTEESFTRNRASESRATYVYSLRRHVLDYIYLNSLARRFVRRMKGL